MAISMMKAAMTRFDYDGDEGVTEVDTSEKDEVATIEGGVVENGFEDDDLINSSR